MSSSMSIFFAAAVNVVTRASAAAGRSISTTTGDPVVHSSLLSRSLSQQSLLSPPRQVSATVLGRSLLRRFFRASASASASASNAASAVNMIVTARSSRIRIRTPGMIGTPSLGIHRVQVPGYLYIAGAGSTVLLNRSNQVQVRMKHPTLRKKIKRKREKKLEKRAAKASMTTDEQQQLSNNRHNQMFMFQTTSKEQAMEVLRLQCQKRHILLNHRQQRKPWIMGLVIHRYDKGVRDLDELNDGVVSLRHPLTPPQNVVHDYIHANNNVFSPPDDPNNPDNNEDSSGSSIKQHRFSKNNMKIAREQVRNGYMTTYAQDAWDVLKDRKIPIMMMQPTMPSYLLHESEIETMIQQNPAVFLSVFSRIFAEALVEEEESAPAPAE